MRLSISMSIIFFATPAYAYIDPGSGSMLLQALAAVALATVFWWRTMCARVGDWYRKVRRMVGRSRGKSESSED